MITWQLKHNVPSKANIVMQNVSFFPNIAVHLFKQPITKQNTFFVTSIVRDFERLPVNNLPLIVSSLYLEATFILI